MKCKLCKIGLMKPSKESHSFVDSKKEYKFNEYVCSYCKSAEWICEEDTEDLFKRFYEEFKDPYPETRKHLKPWHFWVIQNNIDFLNSLKGKKVLEIGFGGGAFCNYLKHLGIDAYGFETDKEAIKEADFKTITEEEFRKEKFDAIFLFEVLEHISDIESFMKNLPIVEEGRVIGTVPNRDRLFFKSSGRRKPSTWDLPPHHKFSFTSEGLNQLFSRFGYLVSVEPVHHGEAYIRHSLLKLSPNLIKFSRFIYALEIMTKKSLGLGFKAYKQPYLDRL